MEAELLYLTTILYVLAAKPVTVTGETVELIQVPPPFNE